MGRNAGLHIHEDLNTLLFPIITEVICTANYMLWNSHVPTLVIHLSPSVWPTKTTPYPHWNTFLHILPKMLLVQVHWAVEQPAGLPGFHSRERSPAFIQPPAQVQHLSACVTEWEAGEKQCHQHYSQGLFEKWLCRDTCPLCSQSHGGSTRSKLRSC